MIRDFRIALLFLVLASTTACLHANETAEYRDVLVGDLVDRPWDYQGTPVRVRGYLVSVSAGAQLLDVSWGDCYGNEPNRRYVTTSLPRSALGAWTGSNSEFDGRLVTVVGLFDNSSRPWPEDASFVEPPEYEAVGPIRHARIEAVGEDRCRRIGETR